MKNLSRRNFVKGSAAVGSFFILPSGLWGNSPNGRVCTAHIGTGGKGTGDLSEIGSHPNVQVVGLCDVDLIRGEAAANMEKYPGATFFQDYRIMLERLGDKIDAVSISTPDHTHYPATLAAMNLGKHVYTQKPLTHKVAEARHLMELAREKSLVTQMGIQVQSSTAYRMACAFLQDGIIGEVSRVYVWSGKNWGYDGAPYEGKDPVPEGLDWNLWLGTAPERAFLEGQYHPGQWRTMIDFGCGTLGDMGVHIFDTPFKALELKEPKWVEVDCRAPTGFGHPEENKVHYGFERTKHTSSDFTFTWWDGSGAPRAEGNPDLELPFKEVPETPDAGGTGKGTEPQREKLPPQGAMFVGSEGRMLLPHVQAPKFYPAELREKLVKPDIEGVNHYHQFVDAIMGTTETTANFDYSAPLVEALLLGTVAARFPGQRLEWDAKAMKVTNVPEANPFLKGEYREY